MQRHLPLAVASAILGLAIAVFLSGPGPTVGWPAPDRAVTSPLVELQAVPAAAARIDAFAGADGAVIVVGWALALAAAGYVVRERRRRVSGTRRAGSASLRGPPRLAAL